MFEFERVTSEESEAEDNPVYVERLTEHIQATQEMMQRLAEAEATFADQGEGGNGASTGQAVPAGRGQRQPPRGNSATA